MSGQLLQLLLAIAGVLAPIVAGLQAWTLLNVVDVKERLARLETRDELRGTPRIKVLERAGLTHARALEISLELRDPALRGRDRLDPHPQRAQLVQRDPPAPARHNELAALDAQLGGLWAEDLLELACEARPGEPRDRARYGRRAREPTPQLREAHPEEAGEILARAVHQVPELGSIHADGTLRRRQAGRSDNDKAL